MGQRDLRGIEATDSIISSAFIDRALDAYRKYRADKEELLNRIADNETYYKSCYKKTMQILQKELNASTSFILSAIENVCADASESFPEANILERDPDGESAADALRKVIPVILEYCNFKRIYKDNTRGKCKYGTAIYGVFFNNVTNDIDIRSVAIQDIDVDMGLEDIQDSEFLFSTAVVPNSYLRENYPEHAGIFIGDVSAEGTDRTAREFKDHSAVIDCYYKKPRKGGGVNVHLMKVCHDQLLYATEDDENFKGGMYDHGKYPFVLDVMYPEENSPFGFGLIDIGKSTQLTIDKLDGAIIENVLCQTKPRYLAKRNSGLDENAFADFNRQIITYEGEGDAIKAIQSTVLSGDVITHRENKKDELKELLANRDFQQGATSGGVTAASAIEALQQSGEKRARSMISDSYDAFREIIKLILEDVRQFYTDKRCFRTTDDNGNKTFIEFSCEQMQKTVETEGENGELVRKHIPLEFDISVSAQRENPYTREMLNNTLLTLWQSNLLDEQNLEYALIVLENMSFDGKDKLVNAMRDKLDNIKKQQTAAPSAPQGGTGANAIPQTPIDMAGGSEIISPQVASAQAIEQMPVPIADPTMKGLSV